jgi:uncharacterized membrane protein YcaP (DUF421 family)
MNSLLEILNSVLGLQTAALNLNFMQVILRGLIVFVVALIMVRLSDKRFLSKGSAFDAILGFILASMLARVVNGTVSFFPTLACGFVLVGLHRALAYFSRDAHWFGKLVKGQPEQVIKNGIVLEEALRKNCLSKHDLMADIRLNGNVQNPQK